MIEVVDDNKYMVCTVSVCLLYTTVKTDPMKRPTPPPPFKTRPTHPASHAYYSTCDDYRARLVNCTITGGRVVVKVSNA